ncbi:MAG: diaminopimelate epimerase [Planctomycetota bacterium]|jgi:diaminopimelate epimerase
MKARAAATTGSEAGALSICSAAGNRFQMWDGFLSSPPIDLSSAAIDYCKRGSLDGFLQVLPVPGDHADCQMVLFNADGGRAETCGNGLRLVGKLMFEAGRFEAISTLRVQTDVGVVEVKVFPTDTDQLVRQARVQFPLPRELRAIELEVDAPPIASKSGLVSISATYVDLGNPHCVIFGPAEHLEDVTIVGKALERHSDFPHRANIEFAHVEGDAADSLIVRVWERGVGETLACGSGAVAVALAAVHRKLVNWPVSIKMRGGVLRVDRGDDCLWLDGPVDS